MVVNRGFEQLDLDIRPGHYGCPEYRSHAVLDMDLTDPGIAGELDP